MATTEVYFIRHGLAGEFGSYPNDAERPLTDEGKKKTRQIAKQLAKLGLEFDLVLTSHLVRAKQTAELLLEAGLSQHLVEADYLATGEIQPWLTWLTTWQPTQAGALALVGHEPGLSHWAEILVWGKAIGGIRLKKAGVIGLALPEAGSPVGQSTLFWLTPPKFLLSE